LVLEDEVDPRSQGCPKTSSMRTGRGMQKTNFVIDVVGCTTPVARVRGLPTSRSTRRPSFPTGCLARAGPSTTSRSDANHTGSAVQLVAMQQRRREGVFRSQTHV